MENATEEKKCDHCGSSSCSCAGGAGSCNCGDGKGCNCPHHKAVPVFVILIALAFLLNAWDVLISDGALSVIWPILLAAIGFTKLNKGRCKCC